MVVACVNMDLGCELDQLGVMDFTWQWEYIIIFEEELNSVVDCRMPIFIA